MGIRSSLNHVRASLTGSRGPRRPRKVVRRPLQLEHLEDRLVLAPYIWTGDFGSLWSWDSNWESFGCDCLRAPYGDPSAALEFHGQPPPDTEHDFTGPTTMQSIAFFLGGGYSLSARPGASVITLTGDITSEFTGQTNTISLALDFRPVKDVNRVRVAAGDTIVLDGVNNLSGLGFRKAGPGTLVMSGNHSTFQGFIGVDAGTLRLGSVNGIGNAQQISVEPGAVLDLNNHSVTLNLYETHGDIRLGNGTLTLNGRIAHIYGDINGTGGLTLSGNARVTLDGTQTYTGPTRLLSGKLEIDGSSAFSPITISAGAGLYGRGATGALTVSGLVSPGNVPQEGGIGAGVLRSDGNVTFLPGSSFAARLNGPVPGGRDGYDQLIVSGTVDLSGSPMLFTSVGYASRPGDAFTILTSTDGITGTFAGLPDGTNFGIDGTPMQIRYTANSVILTHRPQFAPPVPYAAGSNPTLVTTGDFNGDGVKDLVTANMNDASVHVLLGNGDGTFQEAVRYATSPAPTSVTVGDFNGDGALDLVTVSFAGGVPSLSILLGNGDGTFQEAVTYPLNLRAWAVAAGDFRGNGILDLVTVNQNEHTVSVLLGNGDGTFQKAVTYPIDRFPNAVALADFNGDGALDLVTANFETFSVLLGNGDGTFQPAVNFPGIFGGLNSIAVGDFRGTGMLDLIVTTSSAFANSVHVLLGNGDGTFAAPTRVSLGDTPVNAAVGDFDGDGKLDFVYSSFRGVALLYGKGDGSFWAPSYFLPISIGSVAVDSFQGTGFLDVAVIHDSAVSVLLNVEGGGGSPGRGPSGGARRPSTEIGRFPESAFSQIAGADAALRASPRSAESSTGLVPSTRTLPPVREVVGVERFFANATEQDPGSAWLQLRSRRAALLGADDWYVDGIAIPDGWQASLTEGFVEIG